MTLQAQPNLLPISGPALHSAPRQNIPGRRGLHCFASQPQFHIQICQNKTCKKQGSKEILQFAKDLHLDNVRVESTGCLSKCGNGPNIAVSPPGVVMNHMATPARFADAMREVCHAAVSQDVLRATELRLAGNAQARQGDLDEACASYSEAIGLDAPSQRHMLYANRSGVRLALKDREGALQDARAAAECGPASFHTAYIRQIEALAAMQRYEDADDVLDIALTRDAAFGKTTEYKNLKQQLGKLLQQPVTA